MFRTVTKRLSHIPYNWKVLSSVSSYTFCKVGTITALPYTLYEWEFCPRKFLSCKDEK